MLKLGVSELSLIVLMNPINNVLKMYAGEELTDEVINGITSKISNKLNKIITEEQITNQFEKLGNTLNQLIKNNKDIEKTIISTGDA